jgi:nitroimidazol reductase NimA-like FMN-containing flavoprotein (pyridoxamine 5'-phosphate oxidase superfamily)
MTAEVDIMTEEEMRTGEVLTTEGCWARLEAESFGRLAYRLVDEVHIVPLDYAVDGRDLFIRTQSGNKLLAAALSSDVALEIDWRGDDEAGSVVVRGRLRRLEPGEHPAVVPAGRPWVDEAASEVIELVATDVDGRQFRWPVD